MLDSSIKRKPSGEAGQNASLNGKLEVNFISVCCSPRIKLPCYKKPKAVSRFKHMKKTAEWLFHSKELQRRHAPPQPYNPSRSALTFWVSFEMAQFLLLLNALSHTQSGQLPVLGLLVIPLGNPHVVSCRAFYTGLSTAIVENRGCAQLGFRVNLVLFFRRLDLPYFIVLIFIMPLTDSGFFQKLLL